MGGYEFVITSDKWYRPNAPVLVITRLVGKYDYSRIGNDQFVSNIECQLFSLIGMLRILYQRFSAC
jgi:hypothetical protein